MLDPYGGVQKKYDYVYNLDSCRVGGLNWATRPWGLRVIIGGQVSPNKVILSKNNVFVSNNTNFCVKIPFFCQNTVFLSKTPSQKSVHDRG